MKKWLFIIAIVCGLGIPGLQAQINLSMPLLVVDIKNFDRKSSLPRNFRFLPDILPASASGQLTEQEFIFLLSYLTKGKKRSIYIVDLRQESHGFANGIPISWYTQKNQINLGKSRAVILSEEKSYLNELSLQKSILVYRAIKDIDGQQLLPSLSIRITAPKIETEAALVSRLGAKYQRLLVLDHHAPSDKEIDLFLQFIDALPSHAWLHFHCRGGRGRATTFMTLYDITKNAHQDSLETILQRQRAIGGIDLKKVDQEPSRKWKEEPAKLRYEFVQQFYRYVLSPTGLAKQSWSSWKPLDKNTEL